MKVLGPLAPLLRLRQVMAVLEEEIELARDRRRGTGASCEAEALEGELRTTLAHHGVPPRVVDATLRTLTPLADRERADALVDMVLTLDALVGAGEGERIVELFAP